LSLVFTHFCSFKMHCFSCSSSRTSPSINHWLLACSICTYLQCCYCLVFILCNKTHDDDDDDDDNCHTKWLIRAVFSCPQIKSCELAQLSPTFQVSGNPDNVVDRPPTKQYIMQSKRYVTTKLSQHSNQKRLSENTTNQTSHNLKYWLDWTANRHSWLPCLSLHDNSDTSQTASDYLHFSNRCMLCL